MSYNYCTLFNYNYLSRGLVLYDSLKKVHSDFTLYVFAFDEETRSYITKLYLQNCVVIGMQDFEDEELLRVKPTRSFTEYCWTCTPSVIRYAITKYNLSSCTYLDADLYFYTSPDKIFKELSSSSVGITPHNYSKEYDREKVSGRYCVQFVFFRNDENGMKALEWWREKCNEWCYSRIEEDRFGDQKYLDYFSQNFKGVHDINTTGSGIAPWNISRYKFFKNKNRVMAVNDTGSEFPVIFIHFHKVDIDFTSKTVYLKKYYLKNEHINLIYRPYLKEIITFENLINNSQFLVEEFRIKSATMIEVSFLSIIRRIINTSALRRLYNFNFKQKKPLH